MAKARREGILNIDGVNWSAAKATDAELQTLPEPARKARREAEQRTFQKFHTRVKTWIEQHDGIVWNTIGDCVIAGNFPSIDEAVAAAAAIQRRMLDFNVDDNELGFPLLLRIGVSLGTVDDIPPEERGEHSSTWLDTVGHLQKDCPPGRIRISKEVFAKLSFGRHDFRPASSTDLKSASAGSFVWVDRARTQSEIEVLRDFSPAQRKVYPLLLLSFQDYYRQPVQQTFQDLPKILEHSLVILGETRHIEPAESVLSHPAPTSDAVGIIEVMAALSQSPEIVAGVDEWVDTSDLAAQRDVVVVGSPVVNLFALAVNKVLPCAGFTVDHSGLMRIRVRENGRDRYFPEGGGHSELDSSFALVVLTHNPMNPKHQLLWVAGITGMGTQAAACFVRDLVLSPKTTLDRVKDRGRDKPTIAVIRPKWQAGYDKEHYVRGQWRVSEYEVIWLGNQS